MKPRSRARRGPAPKTASGERHRTGASEPRGSSLGSILSRGRVLAGAAKVFASRGAANTTVEDLLRASATSRRTFYKMFSDKEDVLASLFELATTLLIDRVRGAAGAGSPVERVEQAIDGYLDFNRTSGDLMRVLEGESLRPDSRLAGRRRETLETLEHFFRQEIGAALGVSVEPFVTYGLLMALEGVSRRLHEHGAPTEEAILRARRAMLRILLATLAAGAEGPVPPLTEATGPRNMPRSDGDDARGPVIPARSVPPPRKPPRRSR